MSNYYSIWNGNKYVEIPKEKEDGHNVLHNNNSNSVAGSDKLNNFESYGFTADFDIERKVCTSCGVNKKLEDYGKYIRGKDGLKSECKQCAKERALAYNRTKEGLIKKIFQRHIDRSRILGYDIVDYDLEWFTKWITTKNDFNQMYLDWKLSGYKKDWKPSVDRIDDYKGYLKSNIQLMTWKANKDKYYADVKSGTNNKKSKTIVQYDLDGTYLNEYHSAKEAERQTKVHNAHIGKCCRGVYKQSGGFIWRYKDD